jgi:hypothetical protein
MPDAVNDTSKYLKEKTAGLKNSVGKLFVKRQADKAMKGEFGNEFMSI